jgi:hypothetical protein
MNRICHIAIWLVLGASTSAANAGEVRYQNRIDIVSRDGCAFLTIRYVNFGTATMYFSPTEPLVTVVKYPVRVMPRTGIIVDRPPFSIDEMIKLYPGETFEREISLAASYDVKDAGNYDVFVNLDYADTVAERSYKKGTSVQRFRQVGRCILR